MSMTPIISPSPIAADLHLHTRHSHGQASTGEMFKAARDRGLTVIGFSEHSPRPEGYAYPTDYQERLVRGFPEYVREVRRLAGEQAKNGVRVLLGLEVDYIPGQEEYAGELCASYPFDYVIGGLHFQGTWGFDFSARDWEGMDTAARYAAYARYYRDLAAMCRTGLVHIAAHPDLIKIFSVESFNAWLDDPEALPLVGEALLAMKERGVLMEISSAGLRKPCGEIYPGPKIMALAAKMGLPVCFASDAHCTGTPAHAFDQLARYAASFGYDCGHVVEKGQSRPLAFTVPSRP